MSESISKKFFLTICIVFITIIFMLTVIGVYLNIVEYKYTNKVYPNTYLGKDPISGYNYEELVKKLNSTELNNNITIMYNDKKIEARYKDLGIKIDAEKTIETINKHYENMPINDKMFILLDAKKDYVDYLLSTITNKNIPFKVVIDTANGASYKTAEMIFSKLNILFFVSKFSLLRLSNLFFNFI